jgi:hypothetical protein
MDTKGRWGLPVYLDPLVKKVLLDLADPELINGILVAYNLVDLFSMIYG